MTGSSPAEGSSSRINSGSSTSPRASAIDRKSTRLNSSHLVISYAVFCLKKKKRTIPQLPQLLLRYTISNQLHKSRSRIMIEQLYTLLRIAYQISPHQPTAVNDHSRYTA